MYVRGTTADVTANIMRWAATALFLGVDAIWLGMLTRRARLPLKLM
jgi:hypothetical protein